jgi:predicted DNA-binding ribbon-helix-helix protein
MSRLISRNVMDGLQRTSIRLEPELWDAIQDICSREGIPLTTFVNRARRPQSAGGLTSSVRIYIVAYYRTKDLSALVPIGD